MYSICSISHATSLLVISEHSHIQSLRTTIVVLFNIMFFAFFVLFTERLKSWDTRRPGHCYKFGLQCGRSPTAYLGNTRAYVFTMGVYLLVTALGVLLLHLSPYLRFKRAASTQTALTLREEESDETQAVTTTEIQDRGNTHTILTQLAMRILQMYRWNNIAWMGRVNPLRVIRFPQAERRGLLLCLVVPQYPIHLSVVISLLKSNHDNFDEGSKDEQKWTVGQVLAVGMVVVSIFDCIRGWKGTVLLGTNFFLSHSDY